MSVLGWIVKWAIVVGLFVFLLNSQVPTLLGDTDSRWDSGTDGRDAERVPDDASYVKVEPGRLAELRLAYTAREHLVKERIALQAHRTSYYVDRARSANGSGGEDVNASKYVNRSLSHVSNANELAFEYLENATSPEAVATSEAASAAGVGPAYEVYAVGEWSSTMLDIRDELIAAQEPLFEGTERLVRGFDSVEQDQREQFVRVALNRTRTRSTAEALVYYRYVSQFADDPEYRQDANQTMSDVLRGPSFRVGEVRGAEYEVVTWPDGEPTTVRVTDLDWEELPEKYDRRAFVVTSPRNDDEEVLVETIESHTDGGSSSLAELLEGGRHCSNYLMESRSNCDAERLDLRQPIDVRESRNASLPDAMRIRRVELSKADHRKLAAMAEFARSYGGLGQLQSELRTQRGRFSWEVDGIRSRWAATGPTARFGETFPTEEGRLTYLRLLLAAASSYNEDAYHVENGTGYYVDTKSRVEAVQRLADGFESSDAFEDHVQTQTKKSEAAVERAKGVSTTELVLSRFDDYVVRTTEGKLFAALDLGLVLFVVSQVVLFFRRPY